MDQPDHVTIYFTKYLTENLENTTEHDRKRLSISFK